MDEIQLALPISYAQNNKQLVDEAGRDILNYKNQGLTRLLKPKARAKKKDRHKA